MAASFYGRTRTQFVDKNRTSTAPSRGKKESLGRGFRHSESSLALTNNSSNSNRTSTNNSDTKFPPPSGIPERPGAGYRKVEPIFKCNKLKRDCQINILPAPSYISKPNGIPIKQTHISTKICWRERKLSRFTSTKLKGIYFRTSMVSSNVKNLSVCNRAPGTQSWELLGKNRQDRLPTFHFPIGMGMLCKGWVCSDDRLSVFAQVVLKQMRKEAFASLLGKETPEHSKATW